jgi:hypothetical protein
VKVLAGFEGKSILNFIQIRQISYQQQHENDSLSKFSREIEKQEKLDRGIKAIISMS